MIRFRFWHSLAVLLCAVGTSTEGADPAPSSSLPPQAVHVPYPYAWRITRHPALPVLYLGCNGAPGQKNLITFQLDARGNVLTNTLREFTDFFTDDGNNPTNVYSVLDPIVLPEEKVLLLASTPANAPLYSLNSNAHHVAAVALDADGQPAKKLASFRTTHMEGSISVTRYLAGEKRLYISYGSYWGWCPVGADGVPSPEFRMLPAPYNFWQFEFVPRWNRFYGVSAGNTLMMFRVATDGQNLEFMQTIINRSVSFGSFAISPSLQKIYLANGPDYTTINVYSLDKEGRLLGLPRRFPTGYVYMMRVDSTAKRLYTFTAAGTIRSHGLDANGFPTGEPTVWPIDCGSVRDIFVDEPSGRLYIACTAAPKQAGVEE